MHWRRCFDVMEFADMNLTKSLRGCRGRGRVSLLSGRFCDRQEKGPLSAGFFAHGFLVSKARLSVPATSRTDDEATTPAAGPRHADAQALNQDGAVSHCQACANWHA